MVKKDKQQYVCNNCGAVYGAWAGKCSSCNTWNSIELKLSLGTSRVNQSGRPLEAQSLASISKHKPAERLSTNFFDFDTTLGGGIMPGGVTLLAGEPGIGKSTLLAQIADAVAKNKQALYVSGEESVEQVAHRFVRLGLKSENLELAASNDCNDIASTIANQNFDLVIVDSIQTISCHDVPSAAGTVSQISNCTQLLSAAAKSVKTAIIIVGHVTKDGGIAGPKILEHSVDTVLQLDGDRYGGFKILRCQKNRFGPTNVSSIFEMTEEGLNGVANPSEALLAERRAVDGSVVVATIEGSRPLLVEIQALVGTSSFGYPKRTASGFDLNRLNLLLAMLEKRTKLRLSDKDVYVNVVGGIRLAEPAADLAVCMAIASAAKNMMMKKNLVVFGEVGLSGEIRHVVWPEQRLAEAIKLGFDGCLGPKPSKKLTKYFPANDIKTALNMFLSQK
jgi:DNA repair protein RadA/Sms